MSNTGRPINRETLYTFADLLGQFVALLDGDRQQQELNLLPPLTPDKLADALVPLRTPKPLTSYVHDGDGNPHSLFSVKAKVGSEETGGEITRINLQLIFHHPDLTESVPFAFLGASKNSRFAVFLGTSLNTAYDSENKLESEQIPKFFRETLDALGEDIWHLFKNVMLGAANAIPAKDLGPQGRAVQEAVNLELSLVQEPGNLPLCDKMVARVPKLLTFLERVYGLKEHTLLHPFESMSRKTINENEFTANHLLESAFSHEALSDVYLAFGDVDSNGEVNLLDAQIPLRDHNGKELDTLAIVFTPDNIEVQLTSGNLKIAAKPKEASPPVFNVEEMAKLLHPSGALGAEQAAANKELVESALRTLIKSASLGF